VGVELEIEPLVGLYGGKTGMTHCTFSLEKTQTIAYCVYGISGSTDMPPPSMRNNPASLSYCECVAKLLVSGELAFLITRTWLLQLGFSA
jgi:hypothetical protein